MESGSSPAERAKHAKGKVRLVIVNTHPIQYFAPFYAELNKRWAGSFKVLYGSTRGVETAPDADFSAAFKWDVDLLSGYDSEFILEAASNAALPTEQIRCGSLSKRLSELNPEAILVHGYAGRLAQAALWWAFTKRRLVFMRGDTWAGPGEGSGRLMRTLKRLVLPLLMGRIAAHFLAVGVRNAAYWKEIGGRDVKVAMVPYGIDSRRFRPWSNSERQEARRRYGFAHDARIIGYFGKLTEKKGILPLLTALKKVANGTKKAHIIIVGDGPLRSEIEALSGASPIEISLLGFRNQSEIADLYRIADLVIVPSVTRETWGFVVQEALACGTPVAASESVGCVPDLLVPGLNGWVLPAGAWADWADFIVHWIADADELAVTARSVAHRVPNFCASANALAHVLEEVLGPEAKAACQ